MERIVPKDKIAGMRFGQLLCAAINRFGSVRFDDPEALFDYLFCVENNDLETDIRNWLKDRGYDEIPVGEDILR